MSDARTHQRLFNLADRLEIIQVVKEGIASANRGEGQPMDEVFDELEKEHREKLEAEPPEADEPDPLP